MKNLNRATLKPIIENIFQTIPTSYYLKSNDYSFELLDCETSYQSPKELKIVVSFNNIFNALENAKTINDAQIETIIRGLVYHEISHALLTPQDLKDVCDKSLTLLNPTLANILEDERIETIFKSYYMNTNFVQNKRLILEKPSQEQCIANFDAFVFGVARCEMFKEHYSIIREMIKRTYKVNAYCGTYSLQLEMRKALEKLHDVWEKMQQPKNEQEQEQENENNTQNQSNEEQEQEQENSQENENSQEQENEQESNETESTSENTNEEKSCENEQENATSEQEQELTEKECQETIEETLQRIARRINNNETREDAKMINLDLYSMDGNLKQQLNSIIARASGFGTKRIYQGTSYSGTFSTKAFIKDMQNKSSTFKWFLNSQTKQLQENKTKEKVLNIILDNSGSFIGNDAQVNSILKTLETLEKETSFHFNLWLLFNRFERAFDKKRVSFSNNDASGTTSIFREDLSKEFESIAKEKTIFLTDGDLLMRKSFKTQEHKQQLAKNLKALDNKNVCIISNQENEPYFKPLKNINKIVISNNYTQELKSNIIDAFKELFK